MQVRDVDCRVVPVFRVPVFRAPGAPFRSCDCGHRLVVVIVVVD